MPFYAMTHLQHHHLLCCIVDKQCSIVASKSNDALIEHDLQGNRVDSQYVNVNSELDSETMIILGLTNIFLG